MIKLKCNKMLKETENHSIRIFPVIAKDSYIWDIAIFWENSHLSISPLYFCFIYRN